MNSKSRPPVQMAFQLDKNKEVDQFYAYNSKPGSDWGFYLKLIEHKGPEKEVYAKHAVVIKLGVDDFVNNWTNLTDMKTSMPSGYGFKTLNLSTLSSTPGVLVDGDLIIELKFVLFSSNKVTGDDVELRLDYKGGNLGIDFGKMLEEAKYTNVTFETKDGQKVKGHRAILAARSPVFSAMFETDMIESAEGEVKLEDIGSEAWNIVLKYIYTDNVDEKWLELDNYAEVIHAADKYALPKLKEYCDRTLGKKCCAENATELYQVAGLLVEEMLRFERFGSLSLPKATKLIKEFIAKNAQEILPQIMDDL